MENSCKIPVVEGNFCKIRSIVPLCSEEHQISMTIPVYNLVALSAPVHPPLKLFILISGPLECPAARFLKVCRYDQLRRNSCYDKLGCNSLVLIALLLRPP